MAREYPGYRYQLARIDAMYPGRMSLSLEEVSRMEGDMSEQRLRRRFKFVEGRSQSITTHTGCARSTRAANPQF